MAVIKGKFKKCCPYCQFIKNTFFPILKCKDSTKREYWLMTEVFCFLHDGKDYCNYRR
jgi:hypothetical protein